MCARRLGYLALYIMSTSALGPIAVSPGNVPVEEYSLAAAKRAEWESKRRQSVEGMYPTLDSAQDMLTQKRIEEKDGSREAKEFEMRMRKRKLDDVYLFSDIPADASPKTRRNRELPRLEDAVGPADGRRPAAEHEPLAGEVLLVPPEVHDLLLVALAHRVEEDRARDHHDVARARAKLSYSHELALVDHAAQGVRDAHLGRHDELLAAYRERHCAMAPSYWSPRRIFRSSMTNIIPLRACTEPRRILRST